MPNRGDLAVYDRSNPADPSTGWQRHVDRIIRLSDDREGFENIGANEIGGAWRREWSPIDHPMLLGFVEYPGVPASTSEQAVARIELRHEQVG